ncbi:MAG: anti-sigma factor antagonist [Caldilinea sp. CFX5]|nr:anti-sigma factor antagonist [Caldilinea sp. CFX5]
MTGIDVYETQQSALLMLKEGVDALTVARFRHLCDELLARGTTHFIIDLSQTQTMDSAGIAALVYLFKRCRTVGGTMKISKTISPAARRLLRLTRFDRIFETIDIHHRSFDGAGNGKQTPMPEQAASATAYQPDPQLRIAHNAAVLDWQNSLDGQLQLLSTTVRNALQALYATALGAFMQRVNRQFSVG